MSRNINFILNIMALENIKNYNLEKSDYKRLWTITLVLKSQMFYIFPQRKYTIDR